MAWSCENIHSHQRIYKLMKIIMLELKRLTAVTWFHLAWSLSKPRIVHRITPSNMLIFLLPQTRSYPWNQHLFLCNLEIKTTIIISSFIIFAGKSFWQTNNKRERSSYLIHLVQIHNQVGHHLRHARPWAQTWNEWISYFTYPSYQFVQMDNWLCAQVYRYNLPWTMLLTSFQNRA